MTTQEIVTHLWNGPHSIASQVLISFEPHVDHKTLDEVQKMIQKQVTVTLNGVENAKKNLLKLRDILRSLKPTNAAYHHAAADLLHFYAHTKLWFTCGRYQGIQSPNLEIDEYGIKRTVKGRNYPAQYLWGSLIYWFKQTIVQPNSSLSQNRRGTISLPTVSCCYTDSPDEEVGRSYGQGERTRLITMLRKHPENYWPVSWHWRFGSAMTTYGSPWMDVAWDFNDNMQTLGNHPFLCSMLDDLESWQPEFPK